MSFEASAVKSRLIRSARAAAAGAGAGAVVFFHRFAAQLREPPARISCATRLRECRRPWGATRREPAASRNGPSTPRAPL